MEPVSQVVSQAVSNVASITLAALTSLSQWFGDGIAEYQKKHYDTAATAFTRVIEVKETPNPLRETSLYWRSQCFAQLQKTKDAAADLTLLLETAPEGPLASLAGADYKRLVGKDWDWVVQGSPEETWNSVCTAIRKRDEKALMRCLGGRIAEKTERMFEKDGRRDHAWEEMSEVLAVALNGIRYNKAKDKAILLFKKPHSSHEDKLLLVKTEGKWQLFGDNPRDEDGEFEVSAKVTPAPAAAPTAEEQKEIEKRIAQLGSPDAGERRNAYQKLRAFGAKAAQALEKAKGNPDPEIALQARKLLEDL